MTIDDFETTLAGKYPAKSHIDKVARLLKDQVPDATGLLYLEGSKTKFLEDSDEAEPFRQRRNFFYLTGCNLKDCYLTYDLDSEKSTLLIPPIDPDEVMWCGLPMSIEEASTIYDVDEVKYSTEVLQQVSDQISNNHASVIFTITDQISIKDKIGLNSSKINSTFLKDIIERSRIIKDDFEIAIMKKANHISCLAHEYVMRNARNAKNEAELEAIFLERCAARQAKTMAYPGIFASGTACATLHYEDNNRPLSGKLNLLVDAGCEWENYASDITRTLPLSGRFSPESRDIYAIVYKMQMQCIEMIREGVNWDDVHLLAHEIAVDGLLDLGILQGNREDIMRNQISLAFFPHGLGHYLGLDTHDKGGNPNLNDKNKLYRYLRTRGPLPAGSVVTVEPGIYFCRYVIDPYLEDSNLEKFINKEVMERYVDVGGIRLEDNILVTANGSINLTSVAKKIDDVEKIVGN